MSISVHVCMFYGIMAKQKQWIKEKEDPRDFLRRGVVYLRPSMVPLVLIEGRDWWCRSALVSSATGDAAKPCVSGSRSGLPPTAPGPAVNTQHPHWLYCHLCSTSLYSLCFNTQHPHWLYCHLCSTSLHSLCFNTQHPHWLYCHLCSTSLQSLCFNTQHPHWLHSLLYVTT